MATQRNEIAFIKATTMDNLADKASRFGIPV